MFSLDNDRWGLYVPIDLRSNRLGAEPAQIFIFVAFRQHKKKTFTNRDRAFALWTVKLSGIELPKDPVSFGLRGKGIWYSHKVFWIHYFTLYNIYFIDRIGSVDVHLS